MFKESDIKEVSVFSVGTSTFNTREKALAFIENEAFIDKLFKENVSTLDSVGSVYVAAEYYSEDHEKTVVGLFMKESGHWINILTNRSIRHSNLTVKLVSSEIWLSRFAENVQYMDIRVKYFEHIMSALVSLIDTLKWDSEKTFHYKNCLTMMASKVQFEPEYAY